MSSDFLSPTQLSPLVLRRIGLNPLADYVMHLKRNGTRRSGMKWRGMGNADRFAPGSFVWLWKKHLFAISIADVKQRAADVWMPADA